MGLPIEGFREGIVPLFLDLLPSADYNFVGDAGSLFKDTSELLVLPTPELSVAFG